MRSDHHDEFMQQMLAEGSAGAIMPIRCESLRRPSALCGSTPTRASAVSWRRAPPKAELGAAGVVTPRDPIGWKRDGVQEGVFRNLRLGRYRTDACLNLHHCTLAQARDELIGFVFQSAALNIRCALIQQGRARRRGRTRQSTQELPQPVVARAGAGDGLSFGAGASWRHRSGLPAAAQKRAGPAGKPGKTPAASLMPAALDCIGREKPLY